jgi:histidinol-phosphate phosphatase family protein
VQAVVLAGGKGTRLSGPEGAPPKALVPLAGLPAIDYVLGWLAREGVTDVLLCLGHRAEEIQMAVGGGERFALRVRAFVETMPLGTAGAVKAREAELAPRFFVVYGDVVADVDLSRMLQFHQARQAVATLAVHPNDHLYDSDRVVTNRDGRVVRVVRKEDHPGPEAGALASAALYVMDRTLLAHVTGDGLPSDFARDVFPKLVVAGEPLFAYRTTEYIKDMGTPQRRERVEGDMLRGVPASMRLSAHRPAVLTDRDGVLIVDAPRITTPSQIELLPGVAAALEKCNLAGVLAVCCTNQPVIAWGDLSFDGLHELHSLLEGKLGAAGAWLDALYVCPHHPERGFSGERPELKVECECRKPLPGMLLSAVSDLGIDRRASVYVGDRTIDLHAARAAGVLGIGVLTGTALRDGKLPIAPETPIVPTFADAVMLLLETARSWEPHLAEIRERGVVLIGGASRTGKTVAASALALALRARGTPALHVSLDRFIQPLSSRRTGSSLAERTRLDAAREGIARLARHEPTFLPSYDPRKRIAAPGELVTWADGVLIVEGVLAVALDISSALRIEMVAPRDAVQERRRVFYAWKGLGHSETVGVLREREDEEQEIARLSTAPRRSLRLDEQGRLGPVSPGGRAPRS